MPRQHIYMTQNTLDGIRRLVDERRAEGASAAEVNISSVSTELLEIGLRVKAQMKLRGCENEVFLEEFYRKELFEEVIKSRMILQDLIKMFFSIDEVKNDSRYDYKTLINCLRNDVTGRLDEIFSTSSNDV